MNRTNLINRMLLLAIAVMLMLTAVSCSGGIDCETADAFIEDFFDEMEQDYYGRAKSFLHTECMLDLDKYLAAAEKEHGLDFSDGIEIEARTNISKSYYDTQVKGSRYSVTFSVLVGDESATFDVTIVESDNGYGIYAFEIR